MLALSTNTKVLQVCACILRTDVHNASMMRNMHTLERPAGLLAGGAFLCAEARQSGLLHRAYLPAGIWASVSTVSMSKAQKLVIAGIVAAITFAVARNLLHAIHANGAFFLLVTLIIFPALYIYKSRLDRQPKPPVS